MTIIELFQHQGLQAHGPVAWGEAVPCERAGVYVVSLSPDPACNTGLPAPETLPAELRVRWLAAQTIVYVGKAGGANKSNLSKRVEQFYRHHYGNHSPHRGGQDVHQLLPDMSLWLFWAPTQDAPRTVERRMLAEFAAKAGHRPFANRQD
jgi:hypothetical protein